MEHYYEPGDYVSQRRTLDRCEFLDTEMIELDFNCLISVADMGNAMIRIFFYPSKDEKEFSEKRVRALMKVLNEHFEITNSTPPKSTSTYEERHYRWTRDFRDEEGTFHMCRDLKDFFTQPNCDLYLMIENAPMLNCKLVEKERTVRYFEADCSGN